MHDKHVILGVHITDRMLRAGDVQRLFSEYGCFIKTRLGLHHVEADVCSPRGLIILEMFGDEAQGQELAKRLAAIEGVEVQQMIFDHK